MKTINSEKNKILLFCIDKRFETMYITAEIEEKNLVIRYTHFPCMINCVVDYILKFDAKNTNRFKELISETNFLKNLKKKFHTSKAFEKIKEFANDNNLKYKVYEHFSYDKDDCFRYKIEDIYDDEIERLYYSDGSIVIPTMYKHTKNGICYLYTDKGNRYLEITYKDNRKNGLLKEYDPNTENVRVKQYYKDDLLDGIATTYDSEGNIETRVRFEKGNLVEENPKETLEEAYERVFDYDPSEEEVRSHYSDEFNEWCDNFLKDDKK